MSGHESELLGAYVLGVLDADEWATVQTHLETCPECRREVDDLREMEAALGELPPEVLLDGPPPTGDGLLRDTLAEVRGVRRSRRRLWTLAAAFIAVLALAGGILAGRLTHSTATVVTASPTTAVAGTRTASATDPSTGVTMNATVVPAAGWVRVKATLTGVPPGEPCRLFAVSPAGARQQAGSWLSIAGPLTVDGAALMAPADVSAIQAETYSGQILAVVSL